MPWIVGVSGASGTPYAAAVLRALLAAGESVDLVVSRASRLTLLDETGISFRDAHWKDDLGEWLARGADGKPGTFQVDLARVRYVSYNRKLLEMNMLPGPYGAWHLRESSGEQGCWAWVAIGVVCGFAGYRQLAKARQAQTAARG